MRYVKVGVLVVLLLQGFRLTASDAEAPYSIPDVDITLAVETQLLADQGVFSHLIDVKTTEGVVTLSGSVDNLLAKDRAARIARSIKGVRAVVNRISLKPVMRSDEQIGRDVHAALMSDPATDAYEVRTTVDQGRVTLSGVVTSWQEKQLVAKVAKGVKGVRAVENTITISYRRERSDAEIKADIVRRLETDVWVDHNDIAVQVNDGRVTLEGGVGSATEKHRAVRDGWVAGVSSVDDRGLTVEWWAHKAMQREAPSPVKSDQAVAQAIKDAFRYDPRVASFAPEVSVTDGMVTLTGVVDNLAAKRAAAADVKNTVGVWRVRNFIRVRSTILGKDAETATDVRAALTRNSFVYRHEITVNVHQAKVYLSGTVDSKFEKQEAERVASQVNGVVEIDNNLRVDTSLPQKLDWQVKQDIDRELWWSPFVDSDQVSVSVQDKVATLTGTVDSWLEHGAAIENAYEGGAQTVRDALKVKNGPESYRP